MNVSMKMEVGIKLLNVNAKVVGNPNQKIKFKIISLGI
jgi:hypothetical protein